MALEEVVICKLVVPGKITKLVKLAEQYLVLTNIVDAQSFYPKVESFCWQNLKVVCYNI